MAPLPDLDPPGAAEDAEDPVGKTIFGIAAGERKRDPAGPRRCNLFEAPGMRIGVVERL